MVHSFILLLSSERGFETFTTPHTITQWIPPWSSIYSLSLSSRGLLLTNAYTLRTTTRTHYIFLLLPPKGEMQMSSFIQKQTEHNQSDVPIHSRWQEWPTQATASHAVFANHSLLFLSEFITWGMATPYHHPPKLQRNHVVSDEEEEGEGMTIYPRRSPLWWKRGFESRFTAMCGTTKQAGGVVSCLMIRRRVVFGWRRI